MAILFCPKTGKEVKVHDDHVTRFTAHGFTKTKPEAKASNGNKPAAPAGNKPAAPAGNKPAAAAPATPAASETKVEGE